MEKCTLPAGFSMALAQYPDAMRSFAAMSKEGKRMVIAGAHSVRSREEMQEYMDHILKG